LEGVWGLRPPGWVGSAWREQRRRKKMEMRKRGGVAASQVTRKKRGVLLVMVGCESPDKKLRR